MAHVTSLSTPVEAGKVRRTIMTVDYQNWMFFKSIKDAMRYCKRYNLDTDSAICIEVDLTPEELQEVLGSTPKTITAEKRLALRNYCVARRTTELFGNDLTKEERAEIATEVADSITLVGDDFVRLLGEFVGKEGGR